MPLNRPTWCCRHSSSRGPGIRGAIVALVVALPILGCTRGETDPEPAPQGPKVPSVPAPGRVLQIDRTDVEFSLMRRDSIGTRAVECRNLSSAVIRLEVGPSNCGCLEVSVKPRSEVGPGDRCQVVLNLNTRGKSNGGKVSGQVPLSVAGTKETYLLYAAGYVEGPASPAPYVIRPSHIRSGQPPPLAFDFMTLDEGADLATISVTCLRRVYPTVKDGPTPSPPVLETAVPQFKKMVVSKAVHVSETLGYRRRVEMPIALSGVPESTAGDLLVKYRLHGQDGSGTVEMLLLSNEEAVP